MHTSTVQWSNVDLDGPHAPLITSLGLVWLANFHILVFSFLHFECLVVNWRTHSVKMSSPFMLFQARSEKGALRSFSDSPFLILLPQPHKKTQITFPFFGSNQVP